MAWAVNHWAVIVEAWVQSQAWPCGVYGWQSSIEVDFSQCTLVFPCHSFYQCFTLIHAFIHWSFVN